MKLLYEKLTCQVFLALSVQYMHSKDSFSEIYMNYSNLST
jgi:hypothetical protein